MQLLCKAIFRSQHVVSSTMWTVKKRGDLSLIYDSLDTLDHNPNLEQNGLISPTGNWNFHIGYQCVARWSALVAPERIHSPVKVIKSGVHAKTDITEHINATAGINSWAWWSPWAESADNWGKCAQAEGRMRSVEESLTYRGFRNDWWTGGIAHVLPFKVFRDNFSLNCLSGVGCRPCALCVWGMDLMKGVEEGEQRIQTVASCRSVQYPGKKTASVWSAVRPESRVLVMPREKQRLPSPCVSAVLSPYIPWRHEASFCAGATSRPMKLKRRNASRTSPLTHTNAHKKSIQKNLTRRWRRGGFWEKSSAGGSRESKLFGSKDWALCDYDKPIVRTGWE